MDFHPAQAAAQLATAIEKRDARIRDAQHRSQVLNFSLHVGCGPCKFLLAQPLGANRCLKTIEQVEKVLTEYEAEAA